MTKEDEIKLLFECFVWVETNAQNEDLERSKKANIYFFQEQTGLQKTCEMILKMQKIMFRILPPSNHADHARQFDRMNRIVKMCTDALTELEKHKANG